MAHHECARHRRCRLHRLELRPLLGGAASRRPSWWPTTPSPTPGTGPTWPTSRTGSASSTATCATSRWPWPTLRDHDIDTVVHFAAESHNSLAVLDPGRFFRTNVLGTQAMLEAARHGRGGPVPPHLDVRGLRRPPPRLRRALHRGRPLPPPHPLQRLEGGGRPRRAGLRRDLRAGRHHHQLLQQLRPVPVPREGHPALHRPRPRRPAAAAVRLDPEPAGVAARGRPLPGHRGGPASGAGSARPTTWAAGSRPASRRSPTPCSTPSGSRASLKKIVPDRPGHDRRYLLDCTKITDELGWAPDLAFEEGLADTVRVVRGHRPGGSRSWTGPRWSRPPGASRSGRRPLGVTATPERCSSPGPGPARPRPRRCLRGPGPHRGPAPTTCSATGRPGAPARVARR